ncbi:MAG: hypothetical protein J6F30_17160 [Cellulosilyticum sp.]|nr:hypothetical protein [Cellulosilyticum sp.]
MSPIEHYFENLLTMGSDIKGEPNKNALSREVQEAIEICADYVKYELLLRNTKADMAAVLDKIRAEILEEKECAYADFERYKAEYLGQDWEDALDSLPQDDFRYGMERCIDIIDKYKSESEEKHEMRA